MVTPYSYPFRRPFDRAPVGSPTKNVTGIPRREANFDTNMVIILAALLCALIFTLGLNSIIRCALRCSRGFVGRRNDEEAVGRRSGDTGMKKGALRQMPVTVYGSVENVIPTTDCPICLGEFVEGEKLRVLPKCNHGFHVRCIDTWLLSHSSCPNCRHSLLEPAVAAASVDAGVQSPGTRNESDDNGVVVIVNNMS